MATEWISRDCVVAALDMCAVLAHYDIEAGRGTSFRICCPFHEDERPSCSINPEAKVFNCFACGEQGNVLDFIAGMEDLDPKAEFRAVLEKGIEIIGHNPTPQKGKRRKKADAKTGSKKGGKKSKQKSTNQSDKEASKQADNIEQRAAPKKSKKKSKPGRSDQPDGSLELEANSVLEGPAFPLKLEAKHPWLDAQLKRIGVNRSVAAEFGIGFETRSNALMANRICFPIHNAEGDLVAYSGRWASDDGDSEGRFFAENGREQPRYRLPKGFQKQLELYNWHRVLEQFEDTTSIVLVEGFWSVLRLQAHAIPSVALMGISISDAQIRLLLEGGIRSVIVIMDGDEEGQAAQSALVPKLSSYFFTRSIRLSNGIKPDEVDRCILDEVKALCAEPQLQQELHSKSKRSKVRCSSDQIQSDEMQNGQRSYALPSTKVSASLRWTGAG